MIDLVKKNKWILGLSLAALLGFSLIVYATFGEKGQRGQGDLTIYRDQKEQELAVFLEESQGVNEVTIKLCVDENGKIIGAAVICDGGNDPVVKAQIIRLLSAALGLPTNKIEVSGKG